MAQSRQYLLNAWIMELVKKGLKYGYLNVNTSVALIKKNESRYFQLEWEEAMRRTSLDL